MVLVEVRRNSSVRDQALVTVALHQATADPQQITAKQDAKVLSVNVQLVVLRYWFGIQLQEVRSYAWRTIHSLLIVHSLR